MAFMRNIESNTGKKCKTGKSPTPEGKISIVRRRCSLSQSFTDEARRFSERLKSYPRVAEISLSCTFCWCLILFLTFISCF